jgi:hypothetical protein
MVKGNWLTFRGYAPAQLPTKTNVSVWIGGIYRRTTTGYGRTKKPGLQGTVKNPRLLKACMITSVTSCISEFFDIFSSESEMLVNLRLRTQIKRIKSIMILKILPLF